MIDIEDFLIHLVPDASACLAVAQTLRRDHPALSAADLARHAIRAAKIKAATAGAATGVASGPITMIPAAIADMWAVLKIESMLIGVIAALLDPEALRNEHEMLRTDVIGVLFPAAASQALRQVGIRAGERLSQAVLRRYATEDMLRLVTRMAAGLIGKQLTRDALVKKAIPLVGMGIGAGWNWLEVQAIGLRAMRYYSQQPIGPTIKTLPAIKQLPIPPEEPAGPPA